MKGRGCLLAGGIAALIVVLNVVALILSPSSGEQGEEFGSSLSSEPGGTRALSLLYEQRGLKPVQYRQDAKKFRDDFSPEGTVLFSLGAGRGSLPYSGQELDAIEAWVRDGGRLVLQEPSEGLRKRFTEGVRWAAIPSAAATRFSAAVEAAQREQPERDYPRLPVGFEARPTGVASPMAGVERLSATLPSSYTDPGSALPIAVGEYGETVLVIAVGRGDVTIIATDYLANASLAAADNAVFALNLAGGRRPVFDEYHHGFTQTGGSVLAIPMQWRLAFAQLLIAFSIFAWARAPRRTPPIEDPPILPRSRGEYIDALGTALKRSGGEDAAARILQDDLRKRLRKALYLRGNLTDRKIIEAAAAQGLNPAEVADALRPVGEGSALTERARSVRALRRELR